jgi:hypothetical protein
LQYFVPLYKTIYQPLVRTHNPKAVGSNPAPATNKPTDFLMKSVGFLFLCAHFQILEAFSIDSDDMKGGEQG